MTRTKWFLIVQAVLCAVIAALLAAGALSLYAEGAARQAEGRYKTQYGTICSRWERDEKSFVYTCTVPDGTTAHLTLPDGCAKTLSAGNYRFEGEHHG